jgi:hypothetical protein
MALLSFRVLASFLLSSFLNASPYGIAQLNGKAGVRKRCQKSYHTLSASIDFFH